MNIRPLFPKAFLATALLAAPAFAQTDGTVGAVANGNWTTLPWVITSGPAAYPTGGGTATFVTPTTTEPGVTPSAATLTLNVPVALSAIHFNTKFSNTIAGSGSNAITLAATGGTVKFLDTPQSTPSAIFISSTISAPVTGGGSAGLSVSGAGFLSFGNAANSYTGGTHIGPGSTLYLRAGGDAALGAVGAGNDIFLDGGTLAIGNTVTTARNIILTENGGALQSHTTTTVNGVISGSGDFTMRGPTAAITLNAANTYTGATTLTTAVPNTSNVATLILAGNGSLAASSAYDFAGNVTLNNSTTYVANRLNDTAPITLRGTTLALTAASVGGPVVGETAGALTLAAGANSIAVTPGSVQANLTFASISREGSAVLFVRGANLGATPAAGVSRIVSVASPGTLIGGGGSAGSTNISILPWAAGNFGNANNFGSRVVTWDAATGSLRPLADGEFVASFGPAAATDNVRLTADATLDADTTINSLTWNPGANRTLSGTSTLRLTSGTFVYSPTGAFTGTVAAGLDFGSAEGVILANYNLTLNGPIAGSGGLTIAGTNVSVITLGNAANTYTGVTSIVSGYVSFAGTIANDGSPSPFGTSTSAIVIRPGSVDAGLAATAASVVNRDISVQPGGNGRALLGIWESGYPLTINGNIFLGRALQLDTAAEEASTLTLHGAITGPGFLTDGSSSRIVLDNPGNTYSGGTDIQTGTYIAGADHVFGTGTIWFSGAGKMQSTDTTARTFANAVQLVATPTFQGTGSLAFTGAIDLNGSRTVNVTMTGGAKTIFAGEVKGGALTKTGPGILSLANPAGNTYPSGTVLGENAGTLEVNNATGSGTGAGAVSIGTGSTLAGNFTIAGATRIAGTLSPGPAEGGIGTANFGGDLTLAGGSITTLDLASATSFDSIHVGGTLTLDATTTINVVTTNGYAVQGGQSFKIFGWTVLASDGFIPATQINLSGATLAPGLYWDTSNFLSTGTLTAVPEPSTYALGVALLLGATIALRRRRARV